MKKKLVILLLIIVVILAISLSGCNAKVKIGVPYNEYVYDDETADFLPTGNSISFTNDFLGYEMTFNSGVSVMGKTKPSVSGYTLELSDDVLTFLSGLDDLIEKDYEAYQEIVKQIKDGITVNQQVYLSDGIIFSHSSIAMLKAVDGEGSYQDIDGVYDYRPDSNTKFRLKNGFVYKITIKTEDGKTTETQEEKPSLRYVIQDRVVKMIRIDENGKDLYLEGKLQTTSYIYSTITYPKDFSEAFKNGDKASYEKAKQLDGLTIAALTNSFYKAK